MVDIKLEVNVPDEELRAWMDAEIARLGKWFDRFEITWHRTGNFRYGQLYLRSETKYDNGRLNHPYGRGVLVAEVKDEDGLWLPIIQREGRKLYHKLKKDYPVHRDLGKGR